MTELQVSIDDFAKLDVRVARVVEARPLEGARKPALVLTLDCGPELGRLTSSAQITEAYDPASVTGRFVLAVVNLPPRRVAGVKSEALTLGVYSSGGTGPVVLIAPDLHDEIRPGDRLG
ncbi:MAG: tRNA-binding protein [Planctomycetota bacterium]